MAFSRLTIDFAADENSAIVRLRRDRSASPALRPALAAGIHVFLAGFTDSSVGGAAS
jgi:deoxyhypusine synthase